MSAFPKRPGPYVLILLLAVLVILTYWMTKALTDPAILRAAVQSKASRERQPEPVAPLPPAAPTSPQNEELDPVIASMHQEMTQPETPPERELEIIQELISLHQRGLGNGTFGDNGDVTRSLIGESGKGAWLPRQSPRIRDGLLLDRWGSPYWFHPNSGNQIEIRSAGPDKDLFSPDDIILNGSPAGFGATPTQPEP
ncbi:MAG: hypothetical protein V4599_11305 [Verrucomicrobiota bacterium]